MHRESTLLLYELGILVVEQVHFDFFPGFKTCANGPRSRDRTRDFLYSRLGRPVSSQILGGGVACSSLRVLSGDTDE